MFRILAIAATLFGTIAVARADVYRWTDANGTVQYSDRWVRGSVLIKTDKYRPSTAARTPVASSVPSSNAAIASRQAQAQAAQTVKQDIAKTKDEQCKQAKDEYDAAIRSRRIYRAAANGERQYMPDAEADAYRVELLNRRKTACGS